MPITIPRTPEPATTAPVEAPAAAPPRKNKDRGSPYTPVTSQGLGYSSATLSRILGAGRDSARGPLIAANQRLSDTFMQPGSPGLGSGEYLQAKAGIEGERVAAGAGNLREALIADEQQRRQDAAMRSGMLGNYMATLMNARQAYATGQSRTRGSEHSMNASASLGTPAKPA